MFTGLVGLEVLQGLLLVIIHILWLLTSNIRRELLELVLSEKDTLESCSAPS